jgi:hypothetical protein
MCWVTSHAPTYTSLLRTLMVLVASWRRALEIATSSCAICSGTLTIVIRPRHLNCSCTCMLLHHLDMPLVIMMMSTVMLLLLLLLLLAIMVIASPRPLVIIIIINHHTDLLLLALLVQSGRQLHLVALQRL